MKYLVMMDLRPLTDVFDHFAKMYKKNSQNTERDFDLCERYSTISQYIVIGIPIAYWSDLVFYHLATYSTAIILEDAEPALTFFPLLDYSGMFGLILTNILNMACAYVVLTTLIPLDMIIYMVAANFMLNSAVITRDLDDLKVALLNTEKSERQTRRRLLEIIQTLRTFIE